MTEPFPEQDKIMAMDQFLANYFGNDTTKIASAPAAAAPVELDPEAEKTAQMELFCKIAASQGIDLDSLDEDQISYLWNESMGKQASEDDVDGDKSKESEGDADEAKKEDAKKEHEEKKEAMAKMAEATYLGKVMAHSLVAELREISKEAEAGEQEDEGADKEAGVKDLADKAKSHGGKALGFLKNQGRKAVDDVKSVKDMHGKMGRFAKSESIAKQTGSAGDTVARLQKAYDGAKGIRDAAAKRTAARVGGAAAAVGAAGAAASAGKKKESSIDELALVAAVEKIAEAGGDADHAAERVFAVHTLGLLGESEKVASAENVDGAIDVRALEYLEAAGYQVNWES